MSSQVIGDVKRNDSDRKSEEVRERRLLSVIYPHGGQKSITA